MRLAVTGASGQISLALQQLSGPECAVLVLARPQFDLAEAGNAEALLRQMRPDVVVNAGAYTAVDLAEQDAARCEAVNAVGPGRLAAACAQMDIPILQISTDYVFDGTKTVPYEEEDAPSPLNVYGASKWRGERVVAAANPRHVILRTSWVYSPGGRNFVTTMLRLARTQNSVDVVADQFGCPTSAQDLAQAIMRVSAQVASGTAGQQAFGLFHLAGSGDTSWAGLAQAVFDHRRLRSGCATPMVRAIRADQHAAKAARPKNSRLRCDRFQRVFGFSLPHWSLSLQACLDSLTDDAAPTGQAP
ncbi:MAG: dTDP-4-dehydrorhamnose reductase [Proteobacteria bacterium]|nr:dTDP-4-dehydrorhamnose reductase [Pseudomonadota bacterium]